MNRIRGQESARAATIPWKREFLKSLLNRKPYLFNNENQYLSRLIPGSNLNPNLILPDIKLCETRDDYDLFDFLGIWSSFPTSDRPGRRMKFFIVDKGHEGTPIMALGCLSSTVSLLATRDNWIGWAGRSFKEIRANNLAYIMDLSTCVGIPPYSYVTSGKLLCYSCLSREFRWAYASRYQSQYTAKLKRLVTDIALIVVLGAFSRNTPQYRGITLGGETRFRFAGYTKGYSTFHIPSGLYDELLTRANIEELSKQRCLDRGGNPKLRMLRTIARKANINDEYIVKSGFKRAVFIAPTAYNSRTFLLGEDRSLDYYDYSFEEVVEAWKKRWLYTRYSNNRVLAEINRFTPSLLSLRNYYE